MMDLHELRTTTKTGLPLILSPFTVDDIERVWQLCQDPEIQRWTLVPSPYPPSAAESYVKEWAPPAWNELAAGTFSSVDAGPELTWGVRVADGPLAGLWGSLGLIRRGGGQFEIGWWLGAAARGYDIMRAAAAEAIAAAFDPTTPLQATSVIWRAFIGNLASAKVAQHLGFAYTGLAEQTADGHGPSWTGIIHPGDPIAPRDDWPPLPEQ